MRRLPHTAASLLARLCLMRSQLCGTALAASAFGLAMHIGTSKGHTAPDGTRHIPLQAHDFNTLKTAVICEATTPASLHERGQHAAAG
jgi:hypothetical protein